VPQDEIEELRQHTDDLMQGRLPEQNQSMQERDTSQATARHHAGLERRPRTFHGRKAQFFLRIHMLHRRLELHERYLLHPRVLDVLESLIGPGRAGAADHAFPQAARQARARAGIRTRITSRRTPTR
jgi:hypothetical protein